MQSGLVLQNQASLLFLKEVSLIVMMINFFGMLLLLNDWMTKIFSLKVFCFVFFLILQKFVCLVLVFPTHIISRAIARGPEAKDALRDDPWVMAASLETAAFPESLQGVLRPV